MKGPEEMTVKPGKYEIEWSEERSGYAVIEILPEDCDGANDLREAAQTALENEGYPTGTSWDVEHMEVDTVKPVKSTAK